MSWINIYITEISERGKRGDEVEWTPIGITTVRSPKEVLLNSGKYISY